MKYGRPVDYGDGAGNTRIMDVVAISDPLPSWAASADAWLDKLYCNQKAEWVAAGQWFIPVPDGVQPCSVHTGSDYDNPLSYLNPDGTAGDGMTEEQRNPPEEPPQE